MLKAYFFALPHYGAHPFGQYGLLKHLVCLRRFFGINIDHFKIKRVLMSVRLLICLPSVFRVVAASAHRLKFFLKLLTLIYDFLDLTRAEKVEELKD